MDHPFLLYCLNTTRRLLQPLAVDFCAVIVQTMSGPIRVALPRSIIEHALPTSGTPHIEKPSRDLNAVRVMLQALQVLALEMTAASSPISEQAYLQGCRIL